MFLGRGRGAGLGWAGEARLGNKVGWGRGARWEARWPIVRVLFNVEITAVFDVFQLRSLM